MSEPAEKNELIIYENVDTAPFVYFDIAPAHDHGWCDPNRVGLPHPERGVRRKRRNQVYHDGSAAMQSYCRHEPAQCHRCCVEDARTAAAKPGGSGEDELKTYRLCEDDAHMTSLTPHDVAGV